MRHKNKRETKGVTFELGSENVFADLGLENADELLANADLTHAVEIEVEADDRSQLLQDIMAVFAELKTQVSSVTARVRRDGLAVSSLTIQIRDLDHLHKIITKLESLKNVRRVYRVTKRERAQ